MRMMVQVKILYKICIILHYVNVTQRDVVWPLSGRGGVSIAH